MTKVTLISDYTRQFPDPLNDRQDGQALNVTHYVLLCRAKYIPSDIPKDPNPREQDTDKSIYRDVKASLLQESDPTFHLKNKGITLIAHSVHISPTDKRMIELGFMEGDGIVDGAHTYQIIQENKEECPDNQYVKIEVLTGIPEYYIEPIAEGLNTAVQVQQMSLQNLAGRFNWIKDTLKGMPYERDISYKENEDGEFSVRDIVSFMTLFNIDEYTDGKHPKIAYTSKAACLELFKNKEESFRKLAPVLKDILELYDYIHLNGRSLYNRIIKGKGGKLAFYEKKKRKPTRLCFTGAEVEQKLLDGALYPIMGAFRFLLEQKKGQSVFSWKVGSFEKVKTIFDEIGADLINLTKNTSDSRAKNPNAIGKDDNHWDNLYKTVALEYLQKTVKH